jgi:Zn-finger nucleic acid-binding protein
VSLRCPHCAVDMHEVAAEATTGYRLLLDQCNRCGGIWCDRWELFPLTSDAAHRIDAVVDEEALQEAWAPKRTVLKCPRCHARMSRFRDSALPADAHIERCLNCEGMWFNRGELRRVKPRRRRANPAVTSSEIERLAQAAVAPESWPTVANLNAAMLEFPLDPSAADARRELLAGGAWLALRTLLRLVLRF